jgi:mono/diheme cytochrome c family protein
MSGLARRTGQGLVCFLAALGVGAGSAFAAASALPDFLEKHCHACHDANQQTGGLNLADLKLDLANQDNFERWVKIHDRIESGEMPPKKRARPAADEQAGALASLRQSLVQAEKARLDSEGRTAVRRLTRAEYENTIRDLFDMPGIALQGNLPADGSAHGFDKNNEALDISHVNMAKYVEAADHVLDLAIATRPNAPTVQKRRISLANRGGFIAHILMNGDGVLLKDKKPDPAFPPAGEQPHIDLGAHERIGTFDSGSSVGLFRHEDESVSPYFIEHVTVYPGLYRVRTSLWSFGWDKGQVLPARGTEAARLSVVQLTGDGRGGQHPSYVLGYYDAPSLTSKEHELVTWLNHNELIGFNTASLAPIANYNRKGRAMAFMGPGIACDWLDIEGPLHDVWPPRSHRLLFGDLPLVEFKAADRPGVRAPLRKQVRQLGPARNRPDPANGLFTVQSHEPLVDAERLLADFLPKAFRRPVDRQVCQQYVAKAAERLKAGDCFETAMRWAYRAALCSPDFLYLVEPIGRLDDHALACRLSYLFWNSKPDEQLTKLAGAGKLHEPAVMRGEVERLLKDARSQRFVEDFLGQWLKLRQIAANDPDRKLYPEFSPYLQDSMVAETRAYFRELLDKNLDATHVVRSDFVMINEKLAKHYGIAGVSGASIRRVELPKSCPRGGFLTQAAVLKVTANGTTTSPVPRGAFVMARILGQPPDPPPPNIPAVEPDVRGASTIREQLDKHRSNASCASCHAKIDPPGFALESFDVIGGFRTRYRSIGDGDKAERGAIDPFIGISFKLGPAVDASGALADGRKFSGITEMQALLASNPERLLNNLARQFAVYSTGRAVAFGDRDEIASIVAKTQKNGGGIRTLLHELVQSALFQTR